MRVQARGTRFSVQAISGTHVVLFGFDVVEAQRTGLLGFSLHRTDLATEEQTWIPNFLQFEVNDRPGGPRSTRDNPIQAFLWGDYGLVPRQRLRYRVGARYGQAGNVTVEEELEVEIETEPSDDGKHGIYFNRGAAGSQAYTRQFGEVSPLNSTPARRWLSRGLEEGLTGFIRQASGPGFGLRGAFYEFGQSAILHELLAAHVRKGDVKLVVAMPIGARSRLPRDPTCRNSMAIEATFVPNPVPDVRPKTIALHSVVVGRSRPDIPHSKFLVALEGGEPVAVWTGSTNITDGGLYGQSNVGHVIHDKAIAAKFLAYWEQLRDNPDRATLSAFGERETPLPAGQPAVPSNTVLFSPRTNKEDSDRQGTKYTLDWYADRAREAQQAVFLTAPFGVVSKQIQAVLEVDVDFPRYVVLNRVTGDDVEIQRGDADNHITGGAYIGRGGWHQFLEERLIGLNIHAPFVHNKYLIVDPLTDHSLVVTGSANFSDPSTDENDENMLLISGDTRVADIYLTEFMRLFTHLRFRAKTVAKSSTARAPDPREPSVHSPLYLDDTDAWCEAYFAPADAKFKERLLFRAPPV